MELLTHTVKVLATYGWDKTEDASFGYDTIVYFKTKFSIPLEHANVDSSYAKMYISLTENYRKVWWKLFNNSGNNNRWSNILSLVELLFNIPISNEHLERCFSHMKILKTNKRSSLGEEKLLRIHLEGPPPNQWSAKSAVVE